MTALLTGLPPSFFHGQALKVSSMDVRDALFDAGIVLPSYRQGEYRVICPVCSHTRTKKNEECLAVRIDERGFTFHCHHCGWTPDGVPRDLVPAAGKSHDPSYIIGIARKIWNEAGDITGTLGERYFREYRGITIPLPPTLRFHSYLRYKQGELYLPAVIAGVQDVNGKICGIHRIYLNQRGQKADVHSPKMALGPISGGAVRLGRYNPDGVLGVSEGIETGLAAMQLYPDAPVWAGVSSSGMHNIQLNRKLCKHITFYCDNDANYKSRDAALAAGYRLKHQHGLSSDIEFPTIGKDFNDQLIGAGRG